MVDVRRYKRRTYGPIKKMMADLQRRPLSSWLELFLTHHIMVIGLELAFAEISLWWLLTYRARVMRRFPGTIPQTRIIAMNKPPSSDTDGRHAAHRALLTAVGVEVVDVDLDWPDFYGAALEEFQAMVI
jgi:hypothetical protein